MDVREYCRVGRASRLAGVTPAWMRVLCRDGRVAGAVRVDGEWLVPVAEAERVGREVPGVGRPRVGHRGGGAVPGAENGS